MHCNVASVPFHCLAYAQMVNHNAILGFLPAMVKFPVPDLHVVQSAWMGAHQFTTSLLVLALVPTTGWFTWR